MLDKPEGFVIVNLMREFYTGDLEISKQWTADLSKAEVYTDMSRAMGIAEPMSLKAYVVFSYGQYDEKEVFRNFTSGRSIEWGRYLPESEVGTGQ